MPRLAEPTTNNGLGGLLQEVLAVCGCGQDADASVGDGKARPVGVGMVV